MRQLAKLLHVLAAKQPDDIIICIQDFFCALCIVNKESTGNEVWNLSLIFLSISFGHNGHLSH